METPNFIHFITEVVAAKLKWLSDVRQAGECARIYNSKLWKIPHALAYSGILWGYRYILIFIRCLLLPCQKITAASINNPEQEGTSCSHGLKQKRHKSLRYWHSQQLAWEHQLICLQYLQKTKKKGYWFKNSFVKLTGILLKAYTTHLEAISCLSFYRYVLLDGKDKGTDAH